ncbi:unnamed protein product [Diplocarpon coronariae]
MSKCSNPHPTNSRRFPLFPPTPIPQSCQGSVSKSPVEPKHYRHIHPQSTAAASQGRSPRDALVHVRVERSVALAHNRPAVAGLLADIGSAHPPRDDATVPLTFVCVHIKRSSRVHILHPIPLRDAVCPISDQGSQPLLASGKQHGPASKSQHHTPRRQLPRVSSSSPSLRRVGPAVTWALATSRGPVGEGRLSSTHIPRDRQEAPDAENEATPPVPGEAGAPSHAAVGLFPRHVQRANLAADAAAESVEAPPPKPEGRRGEARRSLPVRLGVMLYSTPVWASAWLGRGELPLFSLGDHFISRSYETSADVEVGVEVGVEAGAGAGGNGQHHGRVQTCCALRGVSCRVVDVVFGADASSVGSPAVSALAKGSTSPMCAGFLTLPISRPVSREGEPALARCPSHGPATNAALDFGRPGDAAVSHSTRLVMGHVTCRRHLALPDDVALGERRPHGRSQHGEHQAATVRTRCAGLVKRPLSSQCALPARNGRILAADATDLILSRAPTSTSTCTSTCTPTATSTHVSPVSGATRDGSAWAPARDPYHAAAAASSPSPWSLNSLPYPTS